VLGLDLVIEDGSLRFFHGMAELFGSADLIRRLSGMVREREAKAEQAETKAELAETKAEQAIVGLRTGILAALETRGIVVEDGLRARVLSCDEPMMLQSWLLRALSVASAGEVFAAEDAG
jgi:hypothetical protein